MTFNEALIAYHQGKRIRREGRIFEKTKPIIIEFTDNEIRSGVMKSAIPSWEDLLAADWEIEK